MYYIKSSFVLAGVLLLCSLFSLSAAAAATAAPTGTPTGRVCPVGTHYQPGPQTTWQWQLDGKINTSYAVQIYDIDMFDSAQSLINTLHSQGVAVVCYIDTAYEPGRPDSSQFTAAVLGNPISGWPGQYWVDIRSTLVRNIMAARIALAYSKGCDALEMDDVDSYENNPGFPITAADQINFNTFLATTAHSTSLGIALKNDIDQVTQLASYFDFAINEQCFQYNECTALNTFINQGKAVLGVEYELTVSQFCSKANADKFTWLKKDLDLDQQVTFCCPTCSGTHTCVPDASSSTTSSSSTGATQAPTNAATSAPTSKPTSAPTSAPTKAPTAAPTSKPTKAPTSAPTSAPTKAPTSAPTSKPTKAPTQAATQAPTQAATQAPTDAPTEAPTDAPTESPTCPPAATDAPTDAPTEAPTAAPSSKPTRKPHNTHRPHHGSSGKRSESVVEQPVVAGMDEVTEHSAAATVSGFACVIVFALFATLF